MSDQVSQGWHADPLGRFQHRYWDGSKWTDHVSTGGIASLDPLQPTPVLERDPTPETEITEIATTADQQVLSADPQPTEREHRHVSDATPVSTATRRSEIKHERITSFNGKRLAQAYEADNLALKAEVQGLKALLDEMGVLGVVGQRRLMVELSTREEQLASQVASAASELDQLQSAILVNRDRLSLEEVGLFDYEHPAEASASLATELESVRSQIKQTNKIGNAITATENFTFNNSLSKGKTFVNQMSRIMLRAYNAEAENATKSVKAGNLATAQKRLSSARAQIAKQGTMIDLSVTEHYHRLRLRELELAARHLQVLAHEKELERERRAELREQKVLEQEIKKEKERLEKERSHYLYSIQRLRDSGDLAAADALQAELDRVDEEIASVDYRAANIRAGYVYVISNLGAFGDGVVKIGMTRRLEPMDRIRELGDASVPFVFDVHALFFSDDAVTIEAMLHREFASERINKVNPRKEFFRVGPEAVLKTLTDHKVSVLEFTTRAAADDYRMSWPNDPQLRPHPAPEVDPTHGPVRNET